MPLRLAMQRIPRPVRASLLAAVLLAAGGTSALAQGLCFEPGVSVVPGFANSKVSADLDGDGKLDLAILEGNSLVYIARNLGNGTFAPKELVYTAGTGMGLGNLVAADFDGDLDIDLAVWRGWNPGGGGINFEYADVLRNDGTGVFTYVPGTVQFQDAGGLYGADFDGDGDQDLLALNWGTIHILQNNGASLFTLVDSSSAALGFCGGIALGDYDGDGDVDIVWRTSTGQLYTLTNDGSNHFTILAPFTGGFPVLLADLDGDGDNDLLTRTVAAPYVFSVSLNNGSGAFGTATSIPGFSPTGAQLEVVARDLDADLDLDLVVTSNLAPRLSVLQNLGAATFSVSGDIATDTSSTLVGPIAADMDSDGDVDLLVSENGPAFGVRRYRACATAGEPVCLGDGALTPCPCGNNSAPGAQAGCLNSVGTAGTLRSAGIARLANDTLLLSGSGMPNSTVLYFQGTSVTGGGSGIALGDGLRCAGGSLIRLGVRTNVGGASVFPGPASPSLSALGLVSTPGERIYQAWYRDNTSFCTAQAYNVTNGLRILWAP